MIMDSDGSLVKNAGARASRGNARGTPEPTMKKGPWTSTEDVILTEYVKKNGEGNWNTIQRNTGLRRCGKSCRLRWANHLRPNLKKGAFSLEEEALIVELHAKFGNKWANMAAQLPGRSDNEIKNYWNTRMKRRQRAGLPIYPYHLKPQNYHLQENSSFNPSSSALVSLLSSRQDPKTRISIFDMFSSPPPMSDSQNQLNSSYPTNPIPHFRIVHNKNGLALSLSSVNNSPFFPNSASLAFNNQGLSPIRPSFPMTSIQFNCLNFGTENSSPDSRESVEKNGVGLNSSIELPSIQPLIVPETTDIPSDGDDHDEVQDQGFSQCNSGLLEGLLDESQGLTRAKKAKKNTLDADKSQGKSLWDYQLMEDAGGSGREILDQQYDDSCRFLLSIRDKMTKASSEDSCNPADDDWLSLIDNSPLAVPTANFLDGNGNINEPSSNSNQGNTENENQPELVSYSPIATTPETAENNWTEDVSRWKNLSGV